MTGPRGRLRLDDAPARPRRTQSSRRRRSPLRPGASISATLPALRSRPMRRGNSRGGLSGRRGRRVGGGAGRGLAAGGQRPPRLGQRAPTGVDESARQNHRRYDVRRKDPSQELPTPRLASGRSAPPTWAEFVTTGQVSASKAAAEHATLPQPRASGSLNPDCGMPCGSSFDRRSSSLDEPAACEQTERCRARGVGLSDSGGSGSRLTAPGRVGGWVEQVGQRSALEERELCLLYSCSM